MFSQTKLAMRDELYIDSCPKAKTRTKIHFKGQGQQGEGQQGEGQHGTAAFFAAPEFGLNVSLTGKTLHVSAPQAANVEIFNTLGNKLFAVDQVRGELSLATLPVGRYMVRVRSGSATMMRAIAIK